MGIFSRDRSVIRKRSLWSISETAMADGDSAAPGMSEPEQAQLRVPVETLEDSTLVGSRLTDSVGNMHMPVFDIDFEVELVPSKTPGHYHLYLQRAMTWERYVVLLQALAQAGVIEQNYYNASLTRGQTFVRTAPLKGKDSS